MAGHRDCFTDFRVLVPGILAVLSLKVVKHIRENLEELVLVVSTAIHEYKFAYHCTPNPMTKRVESLSFGCGFENWFWLLGRDTKLVLLHAKALSICFGNGNIKTGLFNLCLSHK